MRAAGVDQTARVRRRMGGPEGPWTALGIGCLIIVVVMSLSSPAVAGPGRATHTPVPVVTSPATTPATAPATPPPTSVQKTPETSPQTAPATPPTMAAVVPPAPPARSATPPDVRSTVAPTVAPVPTTVAPTTTIAGIGDRVTPGAVTLPLRTTGSNGHVSPVFAWLSAVGLGLALLMMAIRFFLTRAGGRDRAPLG
jgi:hypothetical protein